MLKGDDFSAYFYLSRLAYSVGDYAGWRRELEHARRTSPERFAQLKYPFELFEPLAAGSLLEEAGERATWRAIRLSSVTSPQAEGELRSNEGSISAYPHRQQQRQPQRQTRPIGDDFASNHEREKFMQLPPISPEELAVVDLDSLLRRL